MLRRLGKLFHARYMHVLTILNYNPTNIFACAVVPSHMTQYVPSKTGEYPNDIPQVSKEHMLQKIFEG